MNAVATASPPELPPGAASQGAPALCPPERRGVRRDQVRLLVAHPAALTHRHFLDLPRHLHPGDLLVVNNSATLPAELDGTSTIHGPLVVHVGAHPPDALPGSLRRSLSGGSRTQLRIIELRTAPDAARPVLDARAGEQIQVVGGVQFRLIAPYPRPGNSPSGEGDRLWLAEVAGTGSVNDHLNLHGRPISYGYLSERFPLADYQTVFARRPGSAEMPSAARPFTPELVTRLIAEGIAMTAITLHTGLSSQETGEPPQAEWFEVSPATAGIVNAVRDAGGRVVAVGTTVVRALESAAGAQGVGSADLANAPVHARSGWTDLVIGPDRPVRIVDGIITGWHDPHATHMHLIEAVVGTDLTREAYAAAVAQGYLWHEFGDSGLLLRR